MWNAIASAISASTGQHVEIKDKQTVNGGDINQCFIVSSDDTQYFVKLNNENAYENLKAEQENLLHIANTHSIRTPEVVCLGKNRKHSYLVLECLNLTEGCDVQWHTLGEQLAKMHRPCEQAMFGWDEENYIGTTLQPNQWRDQWSDFFAEERIGWQLKLLEDKGTIIGDSKQIIASVREQLLQRKPLISLVHGDLWRGNVGFCGQQPVIFDPACYYGDAEVDIAMTELFGVFPESFYQGYYQCLPPCGGRNSRKHIYQLYHILNHANMFGGSYIADAKQIVHKWVL